MTENKKDWFILERGFHYIVMLFISLLMMSAVVVAYGSIQKPDKPMIDMLVDKELKGAAKPLPDFIIDKVKPDELEQLKP